MKFTTSRSFVKMCRQGIEGSFLGMISGMVLGVIIYFLQFPLQWLSYNPDFDMMGRGMGMFWISAAQPGLLGACFGAIIGALFGCILGLKELSKK